MSDELFLKFVPRVRVEQTEDGTRLHHPHYAEAIQLPKKYDWLVEALTEASHTEEMIMDRYEGDFAAMEAAMNVYYRLASLGLIGYVLRDDTTLLLEMLPQGAKFEYFIARDIDITQNYVVSHIAYVHVEDGQLLIESAEGRGYIVIHDSRVLTWFAEFQHGMSMQDFLARHGESDTLAQLVTCFINIGAIVGEDDIEWDFHDAIFHTRSRRGRYRIFGSKQPLGDVKTIPPAIKPTDTTYAIALYQPDIEQLKQDDMTLTAALETRTSIREHGSNPITAQQVGEFLYRTARVTGYRQSENLTFTRRLYPAGGAVYELEIYLAVQACDGLEAGFYHYNPDAHNLTLIVEFTSHVAEMMRQASSAALVENGQILVLISARFDRMRRFYHTIGYALILKHVGILMQTMYLVATAMNLAICAIGSGDSDLFCTITDIPYFQEGLVGELMLGSRA